MSVVFAFALNTVFNFVVGLLVAKHLGPAEYGRFALAAAIATFINTALFDWLRQAAVRFYSARTRQERPQVRATLNFAFAALALALGVGTLALILSGVEVVLSGALLALAAAGGAANALFDFHAAIVRARFDDRTYLRMVAVKHGLGLLLTVGGAWWFGDARVALAGMCVSVAGSVLTARRALVDDGATRALASAALAKSYMTYALPLVTADVLLFQLAVRADELHGRAAAQAQIARNIAIVLAATAATCVGFWLILPSFEALLAPQSYQGAFSRYLAALLPGFFAFGVAQYAIVPIFQIARRTMPTIAGALVGLAVTALATALGPVGEDGLFLAQAQSLGVALSLATLLAFACAQKPVWPRPRDLVAVIVSMAAMTACVAPLRNLTPGALTLAAQMSLGAVVCLPFLWLFDVGGVRAQRRGVSA